MCRDSSVMLYKKQARSSRPHRRRSSIEAPLPYMSRRRRAAMIRKKVRHDYICRARSIVRLQCRPRAFPAPTAPRALWQVPIYRQRQAPRLSRYRLLQNRYYHQNLTQWGQRKSHHSKVAQLR